MSAAIQKSVLKQWVKDFRKQLKQQQLTEGAIEHRMLGARQFAAFLAGEAVRKGESTTDWEI